MAQMEIIRAVIVQPSAFGKDNRCTLDAIAELGPHARGIVVIDLDTSEAELRELTAGGIRGVRFNMLPGGLLPWDTLEEMAARIHEFGWHIQLQLDGRELHHHESMLHRLPGNLVIDHVGKFLEPVATDHPGFQSLLRLVDGARTWVKLSAVYETSKSGAPEYADVGILAKTLIAAAPERMLWATNWPHLSDQDNPPDELTLRDTLIGWMGGDKTQRQILVDNPAALYGFDSSHAGDTR